MYVICMYIMMFCISKYDRNLDLDTINILIFYDLDTAIVYVLENYLYNSRYRRRDSSFKMFSQYQNMFLPVFTNTTTWIHRLERLQWSRKAQ